MKSDSGLGRAEALRRAMLDYMNDASNPRNAYRPIGRLLWSLEKGRPDKIRSRRRLLASLQSRALGVRRCRGMTRPATNSIQKDSDHSDIRIRAVCEPIKQTS
jgi:hypothetical protein